MGNNEKKVRYSCMRCREEIFARPDSHIRNCKCAIPDVDFVVCKICGFVALALYIHVKKHNLTVEQYEKLHGSIYATNTKTGISMRNSIMQGKSNYRNKLKKENRLQELEEFNKGVSKKVHENIMSNEKERVRRRNNRVSLNKSYEYRKKASETAKITSARPEILAQRSANLKKWRENNPEEFMEKCVKKMHSTFKSEPECALLSLANSIDNSFVNNFYLKDPIFPQKNKCKQVDIYSEKLNIMIEYDGEIHFENFYGRRSS